MLPHPSVAVHVIVDIPTLNTPLALFPAPLLVVAPVIWYVIFMAPLQLSVAVAGGIV